MVPEGWKQAALGEVVEIDKGRSGDRTEDPEAGAPYLGAGAIDGSGEDDGLVRVSDRLLWAEPDDVILLWDGERSGLSAWRLTGAVGSTAARLRPDRDRLVPGFLACVMEKSYRWIRAHRTGQAVPHVPKDLKDRLVLPLPPLSEQMRIAAILSSVREAIRATREVIEQTKRLKQGLLHTLMTRGIGHTRFKKTEIGEIPTAWALVTLESLLASCKNPMRSGPFGSALLKEEFVDEGVPLLGIDNVHEEEFRAAYSRFVTGEKFDELARYAVRPRDVVITIMGTVGRSCVLPREIGPALSSKHLWTMTFDETRYLPELISLQLNYAPWVRRHFQDHSQGGIMRAIRSDVLKDTPLPLPPLDEQKAILSVLQICREVRRFAEREVERLAALKTGLLQDLLTGRVRVPLD